jgi:ribosome-associated protein
MRNRSLVVVEPTETPKPEYDKPSKSQMKRDSTALQVLGREIADLSRDRLKELDLPEKLYEALIAYQGITAHEGKRRQLQYLGKLMRDVDPEPLRAALERFNGASRDEINQMHLGERWRERLLTEDHALAEFAGDYPTTDMQQLRTLIRNAKKERESNKPPKDFRKLYQLIREQMQAAAKATAGTAPAGEEEDGE